MKTHDDCQQSECTEPATCIVKVEAHVREDDNPIEMVLGLKVCLKHVPDLTFINENMWNILDTWAIQGRRAPCDRSLTKIYGIPIDSDEARLLAMSKAVSDVQKKGMH